jgi:hypothetical protein
VRSLLGLLGFVLVVLAVGAWLLPNGEMTTTTTETTTTSKTGTDPSETTVAKTSSTTQPGTGASDALVGVLLGTGAVLLLVAAFWHRIQEVGLPGGGTIKLAAAQAKSIGLDDVANAIPEGVASQDTSQFAQMMSSIASQVVDKSREIAATGIRVVRVDLAKGDKWLLPNLYFFVWLVERWTPVSLVTFTKTEGDRQHIYFACATPSDLRRQLAEAEPTLAVATPRADDVSLSQAATAFFGNLAEAGTVAERAESPRWVNAEVLVQLADPVLTYEAVEIECDDDLSSDELRAILCFPHRFVPITRKERFATSIDKCRVSLELARPLVRAQEAAVG